MAVNHTAQLKKANKVDLYQISLRSSMSKEGEVFIFEKGDMDDLFNKTQAEEVRTGFLTNEIKVKQITNIPRVQKFTANNRFVNEVMTFRYIPKALFLIRNEILIFDNVVAIYNQKKLLIIEDQPFADNQKQLFQSVWEQGQSPKLGFEYKPNHSFYNSVDYHIGDIQVIVWPDVDAKVSYKGLTQKQVGEYIRRIILSDKFFSDATYIIVFIWSLDGDKMVDIWKFNENHVDDRSGPLGDVRVYREGKLCKNLGLASGNTLMVLGYEEKLRRQAGDLKSYLGGPLPKLPLEIVNGKDFFVD